MRFLHLNELSIHSAARRFHNSTQKVGREFQHLEDLVYIHGVSGVRRALRHIQEIAKNEHPLEVKWDGSPAIVFGRDSDGRFHFGDKYSKEILDSPTKVFQYYSRNAEKSDTARLDFARRMALLFPYYEQSTPKNFTGFIEAGLMYWQRPKLKDNQYSFMPNTVEYSVDSNSALGKQIAQSTTGCAATAQFDQLPALGGKRSPVGNISSLFANSSVVVIPPKFTINQVAVDSDKIRVISRFASANAQAIESFLAREAGLSDIRAIIYSYVNSQVDTPENLSKLGHNFASWVSSSTKFSDSKKQRILGRLKNNVQGATAVFKLTQAIMHLKDKIITDLENITLASIGIKARLKTGEPGGEGFVHDPARGDSPVKLVRRAEFTRANRLRESIEPRSDSAVVGWGRGMGHKGHMYLAKSVITHARDIGADPYFFVSRTFDRDNPLKPEEKLAIYRQVFKHHKSIFHAATDEVRDLTAVLKELYNAGYQQVVVVVGEDQKTAFKYLERYNNKPNKHGEVPYSFKSVEVISRQETADDTANLAGPRATPMREVLTMSPDAFRQKHPTLSDNIPDTELEYHVWRDAMPDALSDAQVIKFMKLAKSRLSTNLFEAGNKNFIRNYYGVIKDENTQYYGMITKIKSSDTDISEIRDGFGAEYSLSGQTQSRFPMYQGEWSNNKRHGFGIVSNNVNNSYVVGYWNKNVLNHRRPIIYVTKKSGKTKIYVGLATNEFRVPDPNNVFYIPERHFTNDVVIFEPATETAYQNSSHDMNRLMSSDEMHEIRRMMRVKETLDYMKLTERDHRNREDGFRDLKERYSLILQDLRNQSKATDGSVNVTNIKLSKYAFSTDDSKDEIESGLKDKLSKIKQSDKDDELFKQSDKDDELFKQSDKDDELFKQSDKDDELFKQSDKDELSRANEKLKKLEKEKRDLTQDLDFAIKNNRSALTKSIRAGLTQNDDELNRTRNEITRLENELSKAKQSDKDDELSKMLQYYNSELSKIKQHYDSELSKANEKLEKLEKKKIELKQDLDDARKNNQSEITKAIQAQQNQNYIELGRAQNEITRLENELIKTRNEITRLQDQLYKQQSDIYELSRLQRELENLKKEKRELKRELDDARKNNPALTKAIQAQQNQNDIELERAQNEITRLQDQLIKTRNEITRLQDQLYKQQSSHEDELSKQKWSHKDELSKQKSSHKDELSKMQYQLSSLQSQLKNLENENRELRQSPNVANTKVQQAMNDSKIREIKGAIVGLIVSSGVIIGLPATYDYLSQVKDDRDKRIDVEKKQERNLEDYVNRVTSSINETSSIEDLVMIDTYIKTMSAVDPNQNIRIFDQDDFEKSRSKLLKLLGNKIDSIHAKNLEELIQNTNSSILNATKEKDLRLLDKLDAQITSVTFKDASGIQKFNQDDLEKAKKELSSSILNAKKDISDPGSILDRLSRAWKAFNQDKSSSTPNYAPSKATNVNKASDASPSKSVATNNQSDLQNNIPSKEQNLKNLTDWAETEIQKSLRDFSGENTINRLQEVKRLTLEINNNGSYDNINFTNWKNFTLTRIDTTIERLQNERSQNKSSVSTNASQSSSTSSINKQEKPISVAEKNINLKNLNSSIDIEIRKNLSDSTHLMSMKDRISTLSNSEGKYDSADFFEWKKAIIQRIDSEIERIKKSSTDKRPDTGSASSNAALVDKSINVTNQNNAAPEYPTVSRTKVSDLVRSADIKNLKWNDSPPNLPFITWRGAAFQRNYESDRSNNISRLEKWARDEIESIKNDLDPIVKVARLMKIREGLKAFRNGNYFDEKDFYDMDYRVSLEISNQITRIDNTFKR